MKIEFISGEFSVCQITDVSGVDFKQQFLFVSKTDEELSLVCPSNAVPENVTSREDGWCMMRIVGVLDFSLVGILSKIASVLAMNQISIFAISTYNTDYILIKQISFKKSIAVLRDEGYECK